MSDTQTTLRDMLEQNLAASENGTLGQVRDAAPIEVAAPPVQETQEATAQRERDEAGRFKVKQQEEAASASKTSPEAKVQESAGTPAAEVAQASPAQVSTDPELQGPTTWRKEYRPIWDKIATGAPLSPDESKKLASYSMQREREFAAGVSTYRAEAMAAKELSGAVEPFMPILNQHNMKPGEWISKLGAAHQALVFGTPEQKLQMFHNMAQQYGIPIQAIASSAQGQLDPIVPQLMQQLADVRNQVATVTGWREQQEQQKLQQEVARFTDASKYPHFDQVRGDMAKLLESGFTQDLDTAYAKAVRMNDDVWNAEQERQAQSHQQATQQPSSAAVVAKAKAAAVSPRSATPSGVTAAVDPKDRHSMLSAAFNERASGRV